MSVPNLPISSSAGEISSSRNPVASLAAHERHSAQPVDLIPLRRCGRCLRPPLLPAFEKAQQPTHSCNWPCAVSGPLAEISCRPRRSRMLAIDSHPRQGQCQHLAQQLPARLLALAWWP